MVDEKFRLNDGVEKSISNWQGVSGGFESLHQQVFELFFPCQAKDYTTNLIWFLTLAVMCCVERSSVGF